MKFLPFFVFIPLAAAFLSVLGRKIRHSSDAIANLSSLVLLLLALGAGQSVRAHQASVYKMAGWPAPFGISLVLDGLSSFMLVVINLVAFLVMVYAVRYMQHYTGKWKFHSLFMLMLAGMNGVVISGDMFNLYVFLEIASISGYALVAFGVEPEDLEASFRYAIMGSIASIFILLGIGLLYSYTSTLNMADISLVLSERQSGALIVLVAVLFLAGFGLKTALVPFHSWLPDAHSSAPAPVSATLSGVFIKSLGVYALARVFFNILGAQPKVLFVLMVLGVISMVVGAVLAIVQDDIKRMFAYSSISQVGYIIFALGVGTPLALLGGLFHLFNHACFKSLLFLNAGAIEYSSGTRSLKKLGGLGAKMPVTAGAGFLGAMSISGIPPFAGFWSKLIIIVAGLQAGYFAFSLVAAVVSIITLAYYLKFQTFAFLGRLDAAFREIKEVPLSMKLSMLALAVICVTGGLLLLPEFRGFLKLASDCLLAGTAYKDVVLQVIR